MVILDENVGITSQNDLIKHEKSGVRSNKHRFLRCTVGFLRELINEKTVQSMLMSLTGVAPAVWGKETDTDLGSQSDGATNTIRLHEAFLHENQTN